MNRKVPAEGGRSGMLPVSSGHEVYWEESGNPNGVPVLYLHGGPGSGLGQHYHAWFDATRARIIGLDQRGCGRSRPLVTTDGYDLAENTTAHLIADIERLREHLGVTAWHVSGVSWGSTLALAYAQHHPNHVTGITLMAVTTTSRAEVDWITETMAAVFPEAWDAFASHAEQAGIGYQRGKGRIVEAYRQLFTDPDPSVRDAASRAWATWEDTHIAIGAGGINPDPRWDDHTQRHVITTLVTHYWAHDGFLDPPILAGMDRLAGIPATLINGRRDISGPTSTAWKLHQAWPGSELIVDEGAGHGGATLGDRFREANDRHIERILDDWLR